MSDTIKLKLAAQAAGGVDWKWWDSNSTLRLTTEVNGRHGADGDAISAYRDSVQCPERLRAFIEAASPAAVLALIAETQELGRYLCTCRDCGGEGALHTGDWQSYGHMEPPEPVMEKCGECDGTGLIGEIQGLYQVITERDRLRAENERLREVAQAEIDSATESAKEVMGARMTLHSIVHELDLLKAENEALRKDAERYRFLRNDISNHVQDFCIVKKYWGGTFPDRILEMEGADAEIDAALGKGEQP